MPKHEDGFQLIISGIPRQGKSYFVKKTIIPILVKKTPVFVLDMQSEYGGKRARDANPAWTTCQGTDGLADELEANGVQKKVYVIVAERERDFLNVLTFLWKRRKPVAILIDEAHWVYDEFKQVAAKVKLIGRAGAKDGMSLCIITQRPYDVPPDIRNIINGGISFRLQSEADVKIYEKDKGWPEAENLKDLEKTEYLKLGTIPEQISGKI